MRIVLATLAVITILLSSLSSIRQENIKRLMAYSMSVHSGIMLLGLCVFSVYSLSSVMFYLFCYVIANIQDGGFSIEHRFIDYDRFTASEIMKARGFDGAEKLAQMILDPKERHF